MNITSSHVGNCVSWPAADDTVTVRITAVDSDHISYVSTDGFAGACFAGLYRSLGDITADWRPATPEETANFERLYRPSPDQWD